MAILMVSFTAVLVGYSVSPVHFAKSNFREIETSTVSNFRRALAIGLAQASQELNFRSKVRQYSAYLDLESYPIAKTEGYKVLSSWQNLTVFSYPGTGVNLTVSQPVFRCSWNGSQGISSAEANMTLDLLNLGFYGLRENLIASLNLTLLDLNATGSTTSFFFRLMAEYDRPVSDLRELSISLLYLKTDSSWVYPAADSLKLNYLGQGTYVARFSSNMTEMSIPPNIRLIVEDSRGIIVGAAGILTSSDDVWGPVPGSVVVTPNPTRGAQSVVISASISDVGTGYSAVQAANVIVNSSTGVTMYNGSMSSKDGRFDEAIEDVTATLNVASWALGNYTVYVKGQDSSGNWGDSSSTALRITPTPRMHVELISMSIRIQGNWKTAVAVVRIVDNLGQRVDGALVSVRWSGSVTGTSTQSTNSNGDATFTSPRVRTSVTATFTITITNVQKSGYIYDSAANVETTHTITG